MPTLPITLATRDHAFVTPLATGDVAVDGVDLTLLRTFGALQRVTADPAGHGGEASFSRYVPKALAAAGAKPLRSRARCHVGASPPTAARPAVAAAPPE